MPAKYKLFWLYAISNCDVAGVFDPNINVASKLLQQRYDRQELLNVFSSRIQVIGDKWFIKSFIQFQYGNKVSSTMVKPINKALSKIGLNLDTVSIQYQSSTDTDKEEEEEEEKVKDKEKEKYFKLEEFNSFAYGVEMATGRKLHHNEVRDLQEMFTENKDAMLRSLSENKKTIGSPVDFFNVCICNYNGGKMVEQFKTDFVSAQRNY